MTQSRATFTKIIVNGDKTHHHHQYTPSKTWTINHNLHKFPSITVVDSAGTQFGVCVQMIDLDNVKVLVNTEISGEAYCN